MRVWLRKGRQSEEDTGYFTVFICFTLIYGVSYITTVWLNPTANNGEAEIAVEAWAAEDPIFCYIH